MGRRRTASKTCPQPGCPQLQPCPEHPNTAWANSRRSERVRSGSAQQRDAAFVMRRDGGICHVCGLSGATEVDHVIPTFEGQPGEDLDTVANKAPIHKTPCHVEKTAAESKRARAQRKRET